LFHCAERFKSKSGFTEHYISFSFIHLHTWLKNLVKG
jgi:hypothetical protein